MKKNLAIVLTVAIIIIIVVSVCAATVLSSQRGPFYVGVTYGGDSIEEAKLLIDKVKGYTNLFVFTSFNLMENVTAIKEIGDYAVNAGLNVILYYGNIEPNTDRSHNITRLAQERWNSSFLGLYFNDEPGGRMIDATQVNMYPQDMNGTVTRDSDGTVTIRVYYYTETNLNYTTPDGKTIVESVGAQRYNNTHVSASFHPSGTVDVNRHTSFEAFVNQSLTGNQTEMPAGSPNEISDFSKLIYYYPNGTITCQEYYHTWAYSTMPTTPIDSGIYTYLPDGTVLDPQSAPTTEGGNRSQFTPYETLLNSNPLKDYANTADTFIRIKEKGVDSVKTNQSDLNVLTSDYALYWFDFQLGYDTVLAQFVGNESRERHIALCRGAAETLGGDWGAIVTWKYNQPPYLESGDALYDDLALAYSAGATYGVVFTYPNMTAYGTLTDQHFDALQRFWVTLHDDPASLGSNTAEAAYVVPADYGFGFRNANDKIWGLWQADEYSQKIYNDTVFLTGKYGAGLNILYDGPETPAKLGGYQQVYYYNQTVT